MPAGKFLLTRITGENEVVIARFVPTLKSVERFIANDLKTIAETIENPTDEQQITNTYAVYNAVKKFSESGSKTFTVNVKKVKSLEIPILKEEKEEETDE